MALDRSGLETDLLELFENPPGSVDDCAQAWADIMSSYATSIVPASTTVVAAATILQTDLATAFLSDTTAADMEAAFTAFALSVGGGMAPAFVATPPAGPVGWATSFTTTVATHTEAAAKYANLIHNWMITGTAVPASGGSSVFWS